MRKWTISPLGFGNTTVGEGGPPISQYFGSFKRVFDLVFAVTGLAVLSPLLGAMCLLIWLEDRHSPFYVASRIGTSGNTFRMVKLRSMVVDADRSGVDSTATNDARITRTGRVVRKLKLDEFTQLWNVAAGYMSLVGPRPNVERDVALYTHEERHLLDVRPGITDFASIVFADEGEILAGAPDPDLRYNQVIRPWKSRLGLHYVAVASPRLDLELIGATLLNAISRRSALRWVVLLLRRTQCDPQLIAVASRRHPLQAAPPPGAAEIVDSRLPTLP